MKQQPQQPEATTPEKSLLDEVIEATIEHDKKKAAAKKKRSTKKKKKPATKKKRPTKKKPAQERPSRDVIAYTLPSGRTFEVDRGLLATEPPESIQRLYQEALYRDRAETGITDVCAVCGIARCPYPVRKTL